MSFLRKRFFPHLALGLSTVSLVAIIACTGDTKAKEKPHFTFQDGGGPNGAMMSVDGKPVSEDQLIGDEKLEYIDLINKVYDFKVSRAGQVLLDMVYGDEAKKANMSVQDYVENKVLKNDVNISDKEYNKFVQEKKIPKEQLNPQLKERILAYMKAQKKQELLQNLVVKLSKEHKVVLYFTRPKMKMDIEIGQAPTFGGKDAKVKVVEFSDFQCPFCSRAASTVTELKKIYGNKILLAFKNYPLPMHSQARPASEAAMCVNEQGTDKYWKYHDKLFANNDKLDADNLKKYAKEVGVDMDKFNKCFDEKKYSKLVQDDMDYGNRLGVRSTPTFFINGKLISGAQPIENFREVIDEELSNASGG